MTELGTITQQLARDITGQQALLIRFQNQMACPAFNSPDISAQYLGLRLQCNRLSSNTGAPGRMLSDKDLADLLAMSPEFEADFWSAYAAAMGLLEVQTNTDPRIICWPAEATIGGKTTGQQIDDFVGKFL